MTTPTFSKPLSDQECSRLFRLPRELRNAIYEFVSCPRTNEDGSINLADGEPPSTALLMTCQALYNEYYTMQKAAFRDYCAHTFVVIQHDSPTILALQGSFLLHITSLRLHYAVNDPRNETKPFRITVNFTKAPRITDRLSKWHAEVVFRDTYQDGVLAAEWCKSRILARAETYMDALSVVEREDGKVYADHFVDAVFGVMEGILMYP